MDDDDDDNDGGGAPPVFWDFLDGPVVADDELRVLLIPALV